MPSSGAGVSEARMASPITITVWSDYVCPWCYVGTSELATLTGEFSFTVDWRPFLLRPDAPEEGWPLPDRIKQFNANPDNPLKARANALNIKLIQREVVPNSRRAHEATEFARAHGKLEAFHHGVIERYWSHGDDIHDWAVLKRIATDVGLDAEALQREVDAGAWKQAMEEGAAAGQELGVSAVPTCILGGRYAIQGAQEATVFRRALAELSATT